MVIRAAGLVVLPAWTRRHVSTDGAAVYEVPLSPLVSITQDGAIHQVRIEGYNVPSTAVMK